MNYSALLIKMCIFAVLLAVGYLSARKGAVSPEFAKSASWLIMNIFLTASIINSVLGDRPELTNSEVAKGMMVLSFGQILLYLLAAAVIKLTGGEHAGLNFILCAAVNNLFIGLPVVQSIYGSEAVFYVGMECVPQNLLMYTVGVMFLKKGSGQKGFRLRDILSAPLVASLISLLIFVADIRMPKMITELFSTVSSATVSISMIVIGATLGQTEITEAVKEKDAWIITAVRLIIAPVLTFFILRLFTDNEVLLFTAVVISGCSSGSVCTPVAIRHGCDASYTSKVIMVNTLLCIVTLPLLIYILF